MAHDFQSCCLFPRFEYSDPIGYCHEDSETVVSGLCVFPSSRFLPFAVMHFIGSGAFSRALRYWARFNTSGASIHHPNANGIKLSDYGLVPIQRKEHVRRETISQDVEVRTQLLHTPSIAATCVMHPMISVGEAYKRFNLALMRTGGIRAFLALPV